MHLRAPMASLKRFVASHIEKLVHPSTRATDTGAEGVDSVSLGNYERDWSGWESEDTPFVTRWCSWYCCAPKGWLRAVLQIFVGPAYTSAITFRKWHESSVLFKQFMRLWEWIAWHGRKWCPSGLW